MRVLVGAARYTIPLPSSTVTYVKGEEVPEDHYQLVPKADRRLFRKPKAESPRSAPEAEDLTPDTTPAPKGE